MRLLVDCIPGLVGLERYADEFDRLNALTGRHNPFLSASFLRCYAQESEYCPESGCERLYMVKEVAGSGPERLIGIAPMRLMKVRIGPAWAPVQSTRLTVLASLDCERPGVICAPEDEARVSMALIEHLCSERRWGMLEFPGQIPGAALYQAMHAAENGIYRVRDQQVEPYNEIPIAWADLTAYFRSLNKKMRSNISRQARRLFASGEVQIVLAEGTVAVAEWFAAYCDLDGRSWKKGTQSSIQRHARRVEYYRQIVAGRAGFDPTFIGVILDGVLIAGLIGGSNQSAAPQAHGAWCLEMAYDEACADLGPGQLLLLLAMGEAVRRGDRFLSYMQNFAYYKHRWGAVAVPVVNVQLIRRRSLQNVRSTVGELVKSIKSTDVPVESTADPQSDTAERPRTIPAARPSRNHERARELARAALALADPNVRRLDRRAAGLYLPFEIEA